MDTLTDIARTCRIWRDTRGQELMEYALLGGFVTCVAGAIMPGIAADVIAVFGKLIGMLQVAGGSDVAAARS